MSFIRELVYDFISLPLHQQINIYEKLELFKFKETSGFDFVKKVFQTAKEKDLLIDLGEEVNRVKGVA